jgi:sugar phosphate isomerase/epimerase
MTNLSRREFLGIAGMASTALAADSRPKPIAVGAHPWVYAATRPDRDIYEILDTIFADLSYAGVDGIELMHTALRPDGAVERISRLSEKSGLPVLGMSYSADMWRRENHDAVLEEARLLISRLARLGGRTLGTSVGNAGKPKTPEQFDAQAAVVREMMAVCEGHGVVLNLHNHVYEVADHEWDLKGTLERVPNARLGPDIGWLAQAGVEPVDFIKRYGSRIVFAHLRDRKRDGTWSEAMGEGDMDYGAVAKALREATFSGTLVIELAHSQGFAPTRPLRESIRMSREYVRRVMGW